MSDSFTITGLSVIIPHYGDPAPTLALVGALKRQCGAPDLQIIVVDDASPEPLAAVPGVCLLTRASNGGFGSAVNTGVRDAEHEYLLILNSDLEIEANFVADLMRLGMPLMPAVVSPDIVSDVGVSQFPARHFPRARHFLFANVNVLRRWEKYDWWQEMLGRDTRVVPGVTLEADWVIGAAMLLPTLEFMRIHGFDEGFYMNSEEVDLQRRLRASGLRSYVLGAVKAQHVGGGSSDPERSKAWLTSSALRYAQEWGERPLFYRVALLTAAIVNLGVNIRWRIRGRDLELLAPFKKDLLLAWIH